MDGILPVYKIVGITSYDVIRMFKRAVRPDYKVGHGGTLDPFASGVLLLLLGRATKQMTMLGQLPKTYNATAVLGAKSDTLDVTGKITQSLNPKFSSSQITNVMNEFIGDYEQEIPVYSAAKLGGKPRYLLARAGINQTIKKKLVTVESIRLEKVEGSQVRFVTRVSSGTYIRQLSYDIFCKIGIESYLTSLERSKIGDFRLEKCASIKDFETGEWLDKVVKL